MERNGWMDGWMDGWKREMNQVKEKKENILNTSVEDSGMENEGELQLKNTLE